MKLYSPMVVDHLGFGLAGSNRRMIINGADRKKEKKKEYVKIYV